MHNANSSLKTLVTCLRFETIPDAFLVINDDISFDHHFDIHIFNACLHQFSIYTRMILRRLDEKAVESRNIIEAKFECFLKSKTADENIETADKNMTSKDVFNMFSGQIFLQMLKAKSPHIYNQIVNDLDAVWNAVDIANLAMSYEVRMAKDPDQNQALAPSSLTADSKNSGKSNQTCWWFINGKCKMGEKCTRTHDPTLKKSFETAGLKFNANGKVVQIDNSNEYQSAEEGVRGSTLVATLSSQNFRE